MIKYYKAVTNGGVLPGITSKGGAHWFKFLRFSVRLPKGGLRRSEKSDRLSDWRGGTL